MKKNWVMSYSAFAVPKRFESKPWGKLRPHFLSDGILTVFHLTETGAVHVGSTRQYFLDHADRVIVPIESPTHDPNYIAVFKHPNFDGKNVHESGIVFAQRFNEQLKEIERQELQEAQELLEHI
jgi:hypothetical protein